MQNPSLGHNNLYDPIMYLIQKQIKREFNARGGGSTGEGGSSAPGDYIEPIRLYRDTRGRLNKVEGWEYIDTELTYGENGLLDKVDVKHRLTGKHLQITLKYDDKRLLEEVIPEILNAGSGEAGRINVPNVIEDY